MQVSGSRYPQSPSRSTTAFQLCPEGLGRDAPSNQRSPVPSALPQPPANPSASGPPPAATFPARHSQGKAQGVLSGDAQVVVVAGRVICRQAGSLAGAASIPPPAVVGGWERFEGAVEAWAEPPLHRGPRRSPGSGNHAAAARGAGGLLLPGL